MASTCSASRIVERVEAAMRTVVPLQELRLVVEPRADADGSWIVKSVHGLLASLSRLSGVDEPAWGQLNGMVRSASTTDRARRPCSAAESSICVDNRSALGAIAPMTKEAVDQYFSRSRSAVVSVGTPARPDCPMHIEAVCRHRWTANGNWMRRLPDSTSPHAGFLWTLADRARTPLSVENSQQVDRSGKSHGGTIYGWQT